MIGPPSGFRGLLLPIRQISSASVHNPKKLSPTSSCTPLVRLKSLSCAAFEVIESNPTNDLATENVPGQSREWFRRIPRRRGSGTIERSLRGRPGKFYEAERLRRYSMMVSQCASKRALRDGKSVHGQVIKSGIDPDAHLWVSLVNFYAKCGDIGHARKVLDEMPERDVVSWTALIQGFVAEECGVDGVNMFSEMKKDGVRPNEFTLAAGLKACSVCLYLDFGKLLHVEAIKVGFFSDLYVGSALVDVYAKCGALELADRVFLCMPEKNAVSWNALLNGYAKEGDVKKVFKLFCGMTEAEMKLSKYTLSTVLKGCAKGEILREGQVVHSLIIKAGFELDEFLGCSLVDMYSKCGLAGDALNVFTRIQNPDVVAWSAMLTCLDQQGLWREAAQLFSRMRFKGIRPNHFSFSSILTAANAMGALHYGKSIHAGILKFGFEYDVIVSNALIAMYTKNGLMEDGVQVFAAMKDRDLVSWNALLSGSNDYDDCNVGPKIFYKILLEGLKPNEYTFNSVLRSCSSLLDVGLGKQIHAHIIKYRLGDNEFIGTALIDMYAKTRCLEDAYTTFSKLTNRDPFTWTAIITGYAQTGQAEKAINCFSRMQIEGVKPNAFTLAGCLSACSRIPSFEYGRQLHSMAIKVGHVEELFVSSGLLDMYAKCGCLKDAEAVFEVLTSRDVISWNTMISGYSQHGQGEKSLGTYKIMLDEGTMPDAVTFIGVFSACSQLGLVEEGKKHFNSMTKVFEIDPTIEHYACMVDILVRAGRFDEVESFINEMKLTQHAMIWETVLGGCKMHGNLEFGERAAKKLFKLKPEADSTYILLSNIFASKGRWDDVRKIRKLMGSLGVKKEPGCSWVEIDGKVHMFFSHDASHPKLGEIYLKLEELDQELMSVGYIPKTENVLHNITEGEKREHLQYHSERLALAFALINTNPVKTIRIFKNLRMCGDCHDVMKLISRIKHREIVVRDIKHFHHFKEGTCSCLDRG
ncbi:hypothetical protein UlMin_022623 [Ulmus minor]